MGERIPKGLEGLSRHIAKDVYKKIGNRIAKDMSHEFHSAIKSFYADYYPHYYVRRYRSYYFADPNGVKKYTKFLKLDKDGQGFTVSMKITPNNIIIPYTSIVSGKGGGNLTNMVFYNTWVLGQHGGRLPYNILPEDDRPNIIFNGQSNWVFYNGSGWIWEPPVMDNPPKSQMDAWFKSYATNENMDRLTKNIITQSINRYLKRYNSVYGQN